MLHNAAYKLAKTCLKFYCEKCDYTTSKKSSWTSHLMTIKHNNTQMLHTDPVKLALVKPYKCMCGKTFKHHQSYYRHKSKCTFTDTSLTKDTTIETISMIVKSIVPEIIKELTNIGQNVIHGDNNTINNQKIFNVNLFLNEHCANAMSMQDFAKQIHITMEDLDKNKPDCITNVVIKNIQPLLLNNRPFHCTDISNDEWFIKDIEKGWETDNGSKVINITEHAIRQKWNHEFESKHPEWAYNEKDQEKYIKIAGNANSSLSTKEIHHVLNEISKNAVLTPNNKIINS